MSREAKIPAKLESRSELSDGLAIFRFMLERDFFFEPGQYATLWMTHRGKTLARPYSVASSPSEVRVLEFYINLVKEGKLTPSLWQSDAIEGLMSHDARTKASISGPSGQFVLDSGDTRDLVFIASGTGLAPFVSMIRSLNEDFMASPKAFRPRKIYLIHGVSFPSHLGYHKEMEQLAAESVCDPKRKLSLIYLPTISRPFIDSSWAGLKGRAESLFDFSAIPRSGSLNLEDNIRSMFGSILRPETHVIYVCGHAGTVDTIVSNFSHRGFRIDRDVKRERFYRSPAHSNIP
jgi:ferredoxin/flavodoxin---NADP+ reductase